MICARGLVPKSPVRPRIGRLAAVDVDEIFEYGLQNHGPEAAVAYLDVIGGKYRLLMDHPFSGRGEPELGTGIRSLSCRSHRIYYAIEGDAVVIRRIRHKSSDARRWF